MKKKYPKISIIIPSLNQGQFIERTICSILDQNYPNLELIVIDGGSIDNTRQILKRYSKKLTWFSDRDDGQSDALNKGLKKTTGEIISYLNSDDMLLPGSLAKIAEYFNKHKEIYWLTGKCYIIDAKERNIHPLISGYKNFWLKFFRGRISLEVLNYISQPATFWRKYAFQTVGEFNKELNYTMDYDYWLRLIRKYKLGYIDEYLAAFRIHSSSKSGQKYQSIFAENSGVSVRYSNKFISLLHQIHDKLTVYIYQFIRKGL